MSTTLKVIGAVVAFLAFVATVWAISFAAGWFTAGPNGKLAARKQILSGPNRIVQYDQFFTLCVAAQTAESAISASRQALSLTKNEDDRTTILTNITANQVNRQEAVLEYNQNALKHYTNGQFRASNLPYQLPIKSPPGGTQCAVS